MSLSIYRAQPSGADNDQPAAISQQTARPAGRSFGPDLVRAVAAILVVYLHAGAAYLNQPMPGLVWATMDAPSNVVSHLFWAIELFIMPLFLLLAGFFAYRSWIASGDVGLIRSRARRLLVPFVFGVIVLLPIDYLIWWIGFVIDGTVSTDRLWPPRFPREARQHLYGTAHLWFLLYVFLYCAVLAAIGTVGRVLRLDGRFGRDSQGWLVLGCALPLVGIGVLIVAPEVVFGFQHAFLPVASKWLYSGTFFMGGVAMAAVDPRLGIATRTAERMLGVGVVCGAAAILLGQWAVVRSDANSLAFDSGVIVRVLLAGLTVASAWSLSLAMIGWGNLAAPLVLQRPRLRSLIAYTAAASFWIYLVHHPVVVLAQVSFKAQLPAVASLAKSWLVTVVAVGFALATYELLIRGRTLGRWIGLEAGGRPAAKPTAQSSDEWTGARPSGSSFEMDHPQSIRRVA